MAVGAKPPKHLRGAELTDARKKIFEEESRVVLVEVQGTPTTPAGLAAAFNRLLPPDLRFLSVELAARNFDPLGECRWKRYCYSVNSTSCFELCKSLYWSWLQDQAEAAVAGEVHHMPQEDVPRHRVPEPDNASVPALDLERMKLASKLLVGTHDFAAFQAKGGRVTTVRTIFNCTVHQTDVGELAITCEGNGYVP